MVDRYTKIVLTVIAAALVVIALRTGEPAPARADVALCGDSRATPCHVKVDNWACFDFNSMIPESCAK
jgi:hypothetical protein